MPAIATASTATQFRIPGVHDGRTADDFFACWRLLRSQHSRSCWASTIWCSSRSSPSRLPPEKRAMARQTRSGARRGGADHLVVCCVVGHDTRRVEGLITVGEWDLSVRDLILIAGGLFLLAKATWEIHNSLEGELHHPDASGTTEATSASPASSARFCCSTSCSRSTRC